MRIGSDEMLGFAYRSPQPTALGVLNKFGNTPQADMILKNMGISAEAKAAALEVFQAIKK